MGIHIIELFGFHNIAFRTGLVFDNSRFFVIRRSYFQFYIIDTIDRHIIGILGITFTFEVRSAMYISQMNGIFHLRRFLFKIA